MECDICSIRFTAKRPPLCTSCVRATLTKPRIEQTSALLRRETSHTHAEAVVRPGNDGIIAALPEDADWDSITAGITSDSFQRWRTEKQSVDLRIGEIKQRSQLLRTQIDEHRKYILDTKESMRFRRKVIADDRKQLERQKPTMVDPIESAIKKARRSIEKLHVRMAEAREYLCKEVASLNGLRRERLASGRYEYRLNGIAVPDLRDLNGIEPRGKIDMIETSSGPRLLAEPHELVSSSLDNICRFLGICCYYLSVRVPAEIILPHDNFPHTMILQEKSSYKFQDLVYPNLESSNPSASSTLRRKRDLPTLRPLQLDRPLPKLLQEDTKTFGYFVEGVIWLAWDVAWLCRTQGVESIDTFEDVCAVGKNLHLLFSSRDKSQLQASIARGPTRPTSAPGTTEDSMRGVSEPLARFGSHSHSSVKNQLAGGAGVKLRDGWRLDSSSHNRLFDRLRNYLVDEVRKSEWTFIDDAEWDDVMDHERAVLVGGNRGALKTNNAPAMSVMTVDGGDLTNSNGPKSRSRGQKGQPTEG